jgi:diguanylate cyclase (GGDEF)-like protein
VRVGGGAAAALAILVLTAAAVATGRGRGESFTDLLLIAACLLLAVLAIARRLAFAPPSARAQRISPLLRAAETLADAEVGLALVAAHLAATAATGGSGSPLHPLIYGVVGFAAAAQRPLAIAFVIAAALAAELAYLLGAAGADRLTAAAHALLILGAAAAHLVLLRGQLWRARRYFRERTAAAIRRQAEAARDYRLFAAALAVDESRSRAEAEALLAAGSVEVIRGGARYTLALLRGALAADTAALLWLETSNDRLAVRELDSSSDRIVEDDRIGLGGALGAVVTGGAPLVLARTRPRQIPYYIDGGGPCAFVGVPIRDGQHIRGVLALDRAEPFTGGEVALIAAAAGQLMGQVRAEQVFAALERSKYEHERFFHASSLLGRALTFDQVIETAFAAAATIVEHELAVIALYDKDKRKHRVVGTRLAAGADPMIKEEALAELEFRDNQGLAAMVVKNRHFLPAAGQVRDASAPLFTRRIKLRGAESLLVLPLLSGEEPVGTFTLASRRPGIFRSDIRQMLGVIANQVAVSIENGLIYQKMETMATTDGLTGLTNHRSFQERFDDLLDRSSRHQHKAAVLLCDVDHFKGVNDTHGHPVGDEVLRQVAAVLGKAVRKIDVPARYGGEEFAVLLEATDPAGAVGLAERIRTDVAALSFVSEAGAFQITMSIGIACFPADAADKATLIERADQALYHAKESGRNRVVSWNQIGAARSRKAG